MPTFAEERTISYNCAPDSVTTLRDKHIIKDYILSLTLWGGRTRQPYSADLSGICQQRYKAAKQEELGEKIADEFSYEVYLSYS
jgi:hypothetical protein